MSGGQTQLCLAPAAPRDRRQGRGQAVCAVKVCLVEEQPGLGWSQYLPPALRGCLCGDLGGVGLRRVGFLGGVCVCLVLRHVRCVYAVLHVLHV